MLSCELVLLAKNMVVWVGRERGPLNQSVKVSDTELSCNVSSADNKCREESAKLLGCLIRNCERLVLPYIAPIHKV